MDDIDLILELASLAKQDGVGGFLNYGNNPLVVEIARREKLKNVPGEFYGKVQDHRDEVKQMIRFIFEKEGGFVKEENARFLHEMINRLNEDNLYVVNDDELDVIRRIEKSVQRMKKSAHLIVLLQELPTWLFDQSILDEFSQITDPSWDDVFFFEEYVKTALEKHCRYLLNADYCYNEGIHVSWAINVLAGRS